MAHTKKTVQTTVSTFDRFHSSLVALNLTVVVLVAVLFMQWLFGGVELTRVAPRPRPIPPASDEQQKGSDSELVTPDIPSLDQLHDLEKQLTLVSNTASDIVSGLGKKRTGGSPGIDDHRKLPPNNTPLAQPKWSVEVQADTFESYLRLLSELEIEIGVVDQRSERIVRLSELQSNSIKIEESSRSIENRRKSIRTFASQSVRVKRWERRLISRAGIDIEDFVICHFYSSSLCGTLKSLEQETVENANETVENLKKTRFRLSNADNKIEVKVVSTQFRF